MARDRHPRRTVLVANVMLLVLLLTLYLPLQASLARQPRTRAVAVHADRAAGLAPINAVINGSALSDLDGWAAHSDDGTVAVTRAGGVVGPFLGSTGLSLSRRGGNGRWAFALVSLRKPETTFVVGRTYRMQAWVRDTTGSGRFFGMLLANGNYQHRPTGTAEYTSFKDTRWHLVTRTFVCTEPAYPDTALYLALPGSGSFGFQFTGASVTQVDGTAPARSTASPSRTISFPERAGTAPASTVWNYETGGHGWGNRELQTYTTRLRNAQVDGAGRLQIIARRERHRGADGIERRYTSARLSTKGKVAVLPGSYVEASITAPTGAGVWPAFWLVGTNIDRVGWPAAGELDVFEGQGDDPDTAHAAAHMAKQSNPTVDLHYGWGEAGGSTRLGRALDSGSHTFGVYFDANTVRFFIDRRPTLSLWAVDALASGRDWPFGKPQYMVVNVAVAADSGASTTSFPKVMSVGPISIWSGGVPF